MLPLLDHILPALTSLTPNHQTVILSLPTSIRNNVLIPITIIMLLSSILVSLIRSAPSRCMATGEPLLKHHSLLYYSKLFQYSYQLLTPQQFHLTKNVFLLNNNQYGLHEDVVARREDEFEKAHGDIDLYEFTVTTFASILQMLPSIILFTWVSYCFSGIIVLQLPIDILPNNFKPMFHHSISSVSTQIPVHYVSSMSWYVLNLLGLSSLRKLLLNTHTIKQTNNYSNFNHIDQHDYFQRIQHTSNAMVLPTSQNPFQGALPFGVSPTFREDVTAQVQLIKKLEYPLGTDREVPLLQQSQERLLTQFRANCEKKDKSEKKQK